jgi:hypothetical protein
VPSFDESGLRVTLPEGCSFRLEDCRAYQRLGGRQVSEMDFGWWDDGRQAIQLLELKDYSTRTPSFELLPKLVAKGRDCLVMLHAVWQSLSDTARALGAELPERCRAPQKLRLFFVVKTGTGGLSRVDILPLKDSLESHIKAYAELLGVRGLIVFLLDHDKAIEKGLPVTVLEARSPEHPSGE